MIIEFYIKYSTNFGQSLSLKGFSSNQNEEQPLTIELSYLNENYWYGNIELPATCKSVSYHYILHNTDGIDIAEGERNRLIDLTKKEYTVIDTWNHEGTIENVFYTQPFKKVLLPAIGKNKKHKAVKNSNIEFRVKFPLLNANETVCITGSSKALGNWKENAPVLLSNDEIWHHVQVHIIKAEMSVKYKYGIYNNKLKKIIAIESGEDRVLISDQQSQSFTIIHDGFVQITRRWKGAGVAVPVFSLRSKNSFGVGEFTDLKLLIDWAKQTGLKMVQILPVNDTTATHTACDSYPYAAVSAFALHPIYINVAAVAGNEHASVLKALKRKQKQLNDLNVYNYQEVMKFKYSLLKELYDLKKNALKDDADYKAFYTANRSWLQPYAAFCYLRDKNNTADFSTWKTQRQYNEASIIKLTGSSQKYYDDVAIHYFIQYHLHLQLKEAADYAHENNVILKGDVPIGIYRHSVDAWVNPELYNMDQQAGAPPDDFAVKGQNWGFPTYNWEKMAQDGYKWWRRRFEQMSRYFDAFRIDHILGFFRIWSIPTNAVEGILGRFVPAIPIYLNEITERGIQFDHSRYCKPFITDAIITNTFKHNAESAKQQFFYAEEYGIYELKEAFNNQRKVADYFKNHEPENVGLYKEGLLNIIANVIFIKDENNADMFHFRIGVEQTTSFQLLDHNTQLKLKDLYINYFYNRQDEFWKTEALKKLPTLKRSTNMLVCGEDLGMVPGCVPLVMEQTGILSLEIQRMPKGTTDEFSHAEKSPYLSVVTPSTHDMSTIRGWWEEDRNKTQRFYNTILNLPGEAPVYCEPEISQSIIRQHMESPAMWSVFQLQDLLGMNAIIRRDDPNEERINEPSDPKHYWGYRMHINLEDLLKQKEFNNKVKQMVADNGR
ncbi:4-alpha-glucanotransferase [soil metagenome]